MCLPRIFLIVDDQVHVWTLTPSDMVLTAHITYQNRHVFSEIHTQVAKLAAFFIIIIMIMIITTIIIVHAHVKNFW